MDRRTFLLASTSCLGGLQFGSSFLSARDEVVGARAKPAKSTILFFLCGGSSHIDMWDLKPEAPSQYRGPFRPIKTTAGGVEISEHLPLTARQGHHLVIVRSITDFGRATGDHHAGYYYNLTGNVPDRTFRTEGNDRKPYPTDKPAMGCLIGRRRPKHRKLPQIITLPHKAGAPRYTRPGQFAGRIGLDHDPFYIYGDDKNPLRFTSPSLKLDAGMDRKRLAERKVILDALNKARRIAEVDPAIENYSRQQQKAFELLSSSGTAGAFDIASEPKKCVSVTAKTSTA